jgi:malonyl-CoA O-methyltransferase
MVGSLYCPPTMPPPAVPTRDRVALARWRRRVLAAGQAPWLHQEVARRMMEKLAVIRAVPACLIDWGGGDAAAAAALKARYPAARRVVVEPLLEGGTASTPDIAHPATPWWRRWLGDKADAWLAPGDLAAATPAQLVWSNLHLHWCEDPAVEFARWHAALAAEGFVMFSCYGPDTLRELTELFVPLGWGPPTVPFIDMHDLGDALVHAGFADPVMDMERLTLHWADAGAALAELRMLGPNAAPTRHAGWRTPRWRAALGDALQRAAAHEGGRVSLTVEIIYGHAFRPAPRARVDSETRVSEADMRAMLRHVNPGPR